MNPKEASLLSHLNEARRKALNEGGISTIMFCGQIRSDGDLPAAMVTHRQIVEEEVNHEEVNITGILMGQSSSILHVLEGPTFSVLRILSNLAGHKHFSSKTPIQSGSIVYNTEDRPKRFFPEWYSCTLSEQKSSSEESGGESSEDIVFDMATKILDLGITLSTEVQEELELSRYADKFPGKATILSLAASTDFFTLQVEYFSCYVYY
jgi:hypothetical protein